METARLLRSPDVQIVGLTWEQFVSDTPFVLNFGDPMRASFYFLRSGSAFVRVGPNLDEVHHIRAGTVVGIEGRPHQWLDRAQMTLAQPGRRLPPAGGEELPVDLVMSSIDRKAALLQRLRDGTILIPPEAQPHSGIIRGCVDLIERNTRRARPEPGITRRLAEVIMLELVGYARAQALPAEALGAAVRHDEYLLRALSAFFAQPAAPWTVSTLAEAAGISRAAFAERFRAAFTEPPMRMITRFRLQQGAEMLTQSRAPLGEIAAAIGFGSAPAFVRAFRREYMQSPGDWRRSRVGR